MWWPRPLISALGKQRHEDGKFEASGLHSKTLSQRKNGEEENTRW